MIVSYDRTSVQKTDTQTEMTTLYTGFPTKDGDFRDHCTEFIMSVTIYS